jgi:hypothetical protein
MTILSAVYQNNVPTIVDGGLTPLQLALLNELTLGTTPPFGVNQEFLATLQTFANPYLLSPSTIDPKTGKPKVPDRFPDLVGLAYLSIGDSANVVYLLRNASDCGPVEKNRTEKIAIGTRANIAIGSFLYYGEGMVPGTLINGPAISTNNSGGATWD